MDNSLLGVQAVQFVHKNGRAQLYFTSFTSSCKLTCDFHVIAIYAGAYANAMREKEDNYAKREDSRLEIV